jgi:hypothetical protein
LTASRAARQSVFQYIAKGAKNDSLAVSSSGEGVPTSTLVFQNDLVDLGVDDLDNGWFSVSEVYLTNAYVNQTTLAKV